MKQHTTQWVRKAEEDIHVARALARQARPPRNAVCFHAQQAAEKYLKALVQEIGTAVPRSHDLILLLDLLLPHDSTLGPLRRGLARLTKYAVDYRYPGLWATKRQMDSALKLSERVRKEIRTRLAL